MSESLIVVRGPIGVGKSSVAEALRQKASNPASTIEPDAIKRMLDPNESSEWRRRIAYDTSVFITERLLDVHRTAIVEMHTKYQNELKRYRLIAERYRVPLVNVLLIAPLETCQERAAQRTVPGITYAIDNEMVKNYYCNLEPLEGDLVFDTSAHNSEQIADQVFLHAAPLHAD